MTRSTLICLTAVLGAANALAETMPQAAAAAGTSRAAAAVVDEAAAKQGAGALFDGSTGGAVVSEAVSPPPALSPVSSPRDKSADLVIGTPGKDKISEPKTPLTVDNKPAEAKSSGGLWWTAGGAVVGAGVGFLLGGPIGAAIGAVALGLLAFFLRP